MSKALTYIVLGIFAGSLYISGIFTKKNHYTLEAQTLPYTIALGWDAPTDADATSVYNCWLDGTRVVLAVTPLSCSFPIATLGAHVVGVSHVKPTSIPSESDQATLSITLRQPSKPGNVKVK